MRPFKLRGFALELLNQSSRLSAYIRFIRLRVTQTLTLNSLSVLSTVRLALGLGYVGRMSCVL